MAAPLFTKWIYYFKIKGELVSKPYIDITLDLPWRNLVLKFENLSFYQAFHVRVINRSVHRGNFLFEGTHRLLLIFLLLAQ